MMHCITTVALSKLSYGRVPLENHASFFNVMVTAYDVEAIRVTDSQAIKMGSIDAPGD